MSWPLTVLRLTKATVLCEVLTCCRSLRNELSYYRSSVRNVQFTEYRQCTGCEGLSTTMSRLCLPCCHVCI